jgi:ribosomal-protein-alanine N-acetyltransferase
VTDADIIVREMAASDIPSLLEIERVSFPVPWSAGMFMVQLGMSKETENLTAESGGRVIGYISSWYGYEEVHILSIAVAEESRGGGAADMLLAEALGRAVGNGCMKAILEVRVTNVRARRFYEKHGFRKIGIREGYYSDSGEDALVLEKEIGQESGREGG